MISRQVLLTDLQALLKRLEADLLERSESAEVPEIGEALRAEYQRARQAERTAANYEDWRSDAITQRALREYLLDRLDSYFDFDGRMSDDLTQRREGAKKNDEDFSAFAPSRDIPVSPKYTSADFLSSGGARYWALRGKLDVPKERWIGFPHCEGPDGTLVIAWAGTGRHRHWYAKGVKPLFVANVKIKRRRRRS